MKGLSLLAVAAGLAVNVGHVASAPIGIVVVSSDGHRIVVPVADDETDPKSMMDSLRPWRLSPDFVRPTHPHNSEVGEGDISWLAPGIQMPPHADALSEEENTLHILPHPHPQKPNFRKGGCTKGMANHMADKGFKHAMEHKMHRIMNKFRAALGLPVIKYHGVHLHAHGGEEPHVHAHHHEHHDGARIHHHPQETGDYTPFMSELKVAPTDESEPFLTRFSLAMHSLSPWESRAVTFVLGLGLGSLLRMFIVLAIVMVRGRRACRARGGRRFGGRRGMCRRGRQDPESDAATEALIAAAPPAYSDTMDEKSKATETVAAFKEIVTVEQSSETLVVCWMDVDGAEHNSPASEIHQKYPEQLLGFYEANLKWRPVEEEHDNETHQ